MIGVPADVSTDEAKLIVRRLQLGAYYSIVNAFRASGYLTNTKLKILRELSLYFQLSTERHQAEIRRAVNDEELSALADLITKDDSSYEWLCEGRHAVPASQDDTLFRLPRNVKLRNEAPVKVEKQKEKKICSVKPVPTDNSDLSKHTQTPNNDVKQSPPLETTPPVQMMNILSNTPDLIDWGTLEKAVKEPNLIAYLALEDTNPATNIPKPPTIIPLRVDATFGELLLEQAHSVKDRAGYVPLPLDLPVQERLEKRLKQKQKRMPSANEGGQAKKRKKKNTPGGGYLDQRTGGPLLTTPEPPGTTEHSKRDILVTVGSSPPVLTKAPMPPSYDMQGYPGGAGAGSTGGAGLPPVLQRMPVISPAKSNPYPVLLSPSKSTQARQRSGEDMAHWSTGSSSTPWQSASSSGGSDPKREASEEKPAIEPDPATGYLSTFLNKQPGGKGPGKGPGGPKGPSKSRSKGDSGDAGSRVEVTKNVKIESIPTPTSDHHGSHGAKESAKPTIQILTQPPSSKHAPPPPSSTSSRYSTSSASDPLHPSSSQQQQQQQQQQQHQQQQKQQLPTPEMMRDITRQQELMTLQFMARDLSRDREKLQQQQHLQQEITESMLSAARTPTICVKSISKGGSKASSGGGGGGATPGGGGYPGGGSVPPYSGTPSSADFQMANLYTQQMLQQQLALIQQQRAAAQAGQAAASSKGGKDKMLDIGGLLIHQKDKAEGLLAERQRQTSLDQEKDRYRISPGGQLVLGKFPFEQYPMLGNPPPQSSLSRGPRGQEAKKPPKPVSYSTSTKSYSGGYPSGPGGSGKSRKGAPEDVFRFPDDDEERGRREVAPPKSGRGVEITAGGPVVGLPGDAGGAAGRGGVTYQQRQLHQKLLHERQMMELRAQHDKRVEEDIRKFNEEFCKNITKISAEVEQKLHGEKLLAPETHRNIGPQLTITTPHLTLPVSSGAQALGLPSSTAHFLIAPQVSAMVGGSGGPGSEEERRAGKRKLAGQDHINSLLKSALSLLQKTLKIRPKTRLVNPSYPPHIWHQQSMDPRFVEKGLVPVDLMTVKKKLEFGEYPTFEAFYGEVTHFQKNYSEVYPAEHQLRQEIDEIMGVFLRELKTIYRSHTQVPVPPIQKKPKNDQ